MSRVSAHSLLLTWARVGMFAFVACALLIGGAVFAYERMYVNRVFPGARILNVRLDGLSKTEARHALASAVDASLAKGLLFTYNGTNVALDATSVSLDPDASRELLRYDTEQAVEKAFALGREDSWVARLATQLRMRVTPAHVLPAITIDRAGILDGLRVALQKELHPPLDASFVIDVDARPSEVRIIPEQDGVELFADAAIDELRGQAARLDFHPIVLSERKRKPRITTKELEPLIPKVEEIIRRPSLIFTYRAERFPLSMKKLAGWISVTGTGGALDVTLNPNAFVEGLKETAKSVEHEGKNGSLVVQDGKIISFVGGTDRVEIDATATLKQVLQQWPASSTFPLVVRVRPARLVGEDPEKLGIQELLGVGHSNFAGSPVNRRKNIAHGVSLVNGTIIAPNETFSLLKTLGQIDGAHHWLPELVIKGNRTKPEFGGGLCQIGTTTFRGALASGLPIVERQNHSYRVRYYEPAGTDATIYEPKPDFRFLNDTGHSLLINAYTKGDDVFFEFWGTRDGRVVVKTVPQVFNIVAPPPTKLVETIELPPGKKNCTEIAHAGADTQFTYTVTYPTGNIKKEVFRSHYRPWQAVCLIGVEKLNASSTSSELPSIEQSATP